MYFLETLQVRAPCHGGVLYSFDLDGMLFGFFNDFFCKYFLFSSHFMLFPTFKKKIGVKKRFKNFSGGGGRIFFLENTSFSFHFGFYAIFNIQLFLCGNI